MVDSDLDATNGLGMDSCHERVARRVREAGAAMIGLCAFVGGMAVAWAQPAPAVTEETGIEAPAERQGALEEGAAEDAATEGEVADDGSAEAPSRVAGTVEGHATEMPPAISTAAETPSVASTEKVAAAFARDTRAGVMLRLIDHHAQQARRERIVAGSIGMAVAGSQLALGVVGYVALDDAGTGMQRAATSQMVVGSIGIVTSITQVAFRSPLERMRRSATYGRLSADAADVAAYQSLYSEWEAAAKRGRKRRLAFGGIGLTLGAALSATATARLVASGTTDGERVWAYTTLASGVGVVFASLTGLLLPGEAERSFAAIEVAQPPATPRVRVAPSLGGMTVMGRF